jgi:hypothetical protein
MNLSQCTDHGKSERSWSHLEEAIVPPSRSVRILGHPVRRVVVVVITHQHNSMVVDHPGILARPVHCFRIAVLLEEGLKIYNSTCRKGRYSMSASAILKLLLVPAAAGQGKITITTRVSRAAAADREEMVDIAEVSSQSSSKAHLLRLLLQLAHIPHQIPAGVSWQGRSALAASYCGHTKGRQ